MIKPARLLHGAAVAVLLLLPIAPAHGQSGLPGPAKVVEGYFASWKLWSGESVDMLPAARLTHLLYAFGIVSAEGLASLADPCVDIGECRQGQPPAGPGGAFARLAELKRRYPQLRLLISIGGWSGSRYFSLAASNAENRRGFADSVIQVFFLEHRGLFDGVDIDWEYPAAEGAPGNVVSPLDGQHLTLLIQEMRRHLDQLSTSTGRQYELSLAVPADRAKAAHFELAPLSGIVDRIGLMSYDYYAGAAIAGFNAPLFASAQAPSPEKNVDASVRMLLAAGVPRDRLVLGLSFYGRAYRNVPPTNDGLFQPADPNVPAAWGGTAGIDYRDLAAKRPLRLGFILRRDANARVPWLYNRQTRIWISYDDPRSIRAKAEYARSHGLAGVMIWHLGADDGTLLRAAVDQTPAHGSNIDHK